MVVNTIQKRSLGGTGIQVTPIGLGVMQFSGGSGVFKMIFPDLSQQQMTAIVKTALDNGINWFDTAEMYGQGKSEHSLATALKELGVQDGEVIIGTKWFPIFRTASNIPRSIDDRLHFLDGYKIDVYMVHQPWGFSSPEAEMNAMADLVEAGKIRSVGVSNFNSGQMVRAYKTLEKRGLPLAVNQVQYSLLHRKIESNGVLAAAKDLGVTIVAWSPLARGILSGKFHNNPETYQNLQLGRKMLMRGKINKSAGVVVELNRIGQKYGVTPAQVALNWVINFQGETVVAIPGASKTYQAEESAGAMGFRLSDEELARLDQLSREFL
ncbi:MAG: aldo/keto reductase [Anaerolineales bacterium]|jgi:aryl-alcohol dehydrogenase-like predicted oxidoreductase